MQALRTLVALADQRSFKGAGDALGITQSAASQQVKQLESLLGVLLVRRRGRAQVELTRAGREFAAEAASLLSALETAMQRLKRSHDEQLGITLPPSLLARWLLPRIAGFQADHPHLDVHLQAEKRAVALERDGLHVAIRYCSPDSGLATAHLLCREWLCPMASPAVAAAVRAGARVPLLADDYDTWALWEASAPAAAPPWVAGARAGLTLTDAAMLLQAAENGQGVALGRRLLARDALQAGRLTTLTDQWTLARGSYYLLLAEGSPEHAPTLAFAAWLRAQLPTASDPSA